MVDADSGRVGDLRMADRDVLDVDGGDPLPAGLDHILGAVGDDHGADPVDRGDIAGVEIAFGVEHMAAGALEVATGHCSAAHEQAAGGLAVARQLFAVIVNDGEFDAEGRAALLHLLLHARVDIGVLHAGRQRAERAKRRGFGHAPGVDDVHFVVLLEGAQDAFRDGGAADQDFLEIGQFQVVGLQVRQQHQPDGRHGGGDRDFLIGQQFVDRGAVHLRAGHHHVGAGRRARHCEAPGIGVEHRHDREHRVGCAHAHRILAHGDKRVEHVGAVGIKHALRVAGGAGGVAEPAGGIFREVAPAGIGAASVDPDVERDRAELVLGHGVRAGIDDEGFYRLELALDGLDDRQEGLVEDENLVFGVVSDPGDLLGMEARVDRVQDRADAHGAVPGGHVAFGVPAKGRDPVAEADASVPEGR